MRALSFLEWYFTQKGDYRWYDKQNDFINHSYKVLDFYNQPFSVAMLVNAVMADKVNIKPLIKQSESLRLFDGWEKNADNSYLFKCFQVWYSDDIHKFVICVDDYPKLRHWEFETLNEFITLANQFYSKLQWNESNPKVKEMFK